MSISYRSKLAYAWERATHKDRIYSHVFEADTHAETIKNGKLVPVTVSEDTLWLKAEPIEGTNVFRLTKCFSKKYSSNSKPAYLAVPIAGIYSRDQAIAQIKKWEVSNIESHATLAIKQPFKAFIKTKLAN